MKNRKLFAGAHIRNLRNQENLTQHECALRLGISTSYLNQIENNQRPLTASVILALIDEFKIDISHLTSDEGSRKLTNLKEVFADPIFQNNTPSVQEIKIATNNTPNFSQAILTLHSAYQALQEKIASMDDILGSGSADMQSQPYDEVRDFFHYRNNYLDNLDRAAETFHKNTDLSTQALIQYLATHHNIIVSITNKINPNSLTYFNSDSKILFLNINMPEATRNFHLLQHIGYIELYNEINEILDSANFRSPTAHEIARLGLGNYFAGAALMPYSDFLKAAQELRHDLELLSDRFNTSLEQVAHRLSTLQRPGEKGIPFFFLRVDRSGTITKRHSATQLQFARFGGACPLWNVHQAFEYPNEFVRQLATTPDGENYFCIARTITKRARGYNASKRRYAIGLGCHVKDAGKIIYADGMTFDNKAAYDEIGISCRICERTHCTHRSVPPIGKKLHIDPSIRNIVPFTIIEE